MILKLRESDKKEREREREQQWKIGKVKLRTTFNQLKRESFSAHVMK